MPSIKECTTKSVYFNLIADTDVLDYIINSKISFSTLVKRLIRKEILLNPIPTVNKYEYKKNKTNFKKSTAPTISTINTGTTETIVIIPKTNFSIERIQGSTTQVEKVLQTAIDTDNQFVLGTKSREQYIEPMQLDSTKSKLHDLLGNQTMQLQK